MRPVLMKCNHIVVQYDRVYMHVYCNDNIIYIQYRYDMMVRCWDGEPAHRPSFSDLVTDITSQLDSVAGGYVKMVPI